jgi:hypothetical protein
MSFRKHVQENFTRFAHKLTKQSILSQQNRTIAATFKKNMIPTLAVFIFILSIAFPNGTRYATAFAPSVTASKLKAVAGIVDIEQPVSVLLNEHAEKISAMKSIAKSVVGKDEFKDLPYNIDVYYLQFCLQSPNDEFHAIKLLKTNLAWRTHDQGKGKAICDAAILAVKQNAAAVWHIGHGPVFAEAPHGATICTFLNPSSILTTTAANGDLVYCIRAREVQLPALQKAVSVEQLQDFFLYIREVQSLTSLQSSLELNRWVRLITANDLAGASLIGGGPSYFRQALSDFTHIAQTLYPAVTEGPILLLNLPLLLKGIVNFITPDALKPNVKFENGFIALKEVKHLVEVAVSATGPQRQAFLQELNQILYSSSKKNQRVEGTPINMQAPFGRVDADSAISSWADFMHLLAI